MSLQKEQERRLVEACKRGQRLAQRELYDRYAKAMLNTAHRILNDREEARDVLQESFLKVFQRMGQYRSEASLGAWIKRIVVNTALNQLKKRGPLLNSDLEVVQEEPVANEQGEQQLHLKLAMDALAALPDGYRTVVTLYLLEGYDHSEISEILGIGLSTSLSQYARGKKKLRTIIQKMQENGSDRTILPISPR